MPLKRGTMTHFEFHIKHIVEHIGSGIAETGTAYSCFSNGMDDRLHIDKVITTVVIRSLDDPT